MRLGSYDDTTLHYFRFSIGSPVEIHSQNGHGDLGFNTGL